MNECIELKHIFAQTEILVIMAAVTLISSFPLSSFPSFASFMLSVPTMMTTLFFSFFLAFFLFFFFFVFPSVGRRHRDGHGVGS